MKTFNHILSFLEVRQLGNGFIIRPIVTLLSMFQSSVFSYTREISLRYVLITQFIFKYERDLLFLANLGR